MVLMVTVIMAMVLLVLVLLVMVVHGADASASSNCWRGGMKMEL
jgi:hypothetical protein